MRRAERERLGALWVLLWSSAWHGCAAAPPSADYAPNVAHTEPSAIARALQPAFESQAMGDAKRSGRTRSAIRVTAGTTPRLLAQLPGRIRTQPLVTARGAIYAASDDGTVVAVEPSGETRFAVRVSARILATPVLDATDTLYVGTEAGELLAIDARGGMRELARVRAPIVAPLGLSRDPSSGEPLVLVAADGLHGFSRGGALRLRYVTGDRLLAAPAVHPQGFIVVGTMHGALLAIGFDSALRWRATVHGAVEGGAAIADDGAIVVANTLGHVLRLSADGELLSALGLPSAVRSVPAISAQGQVLLGTEGALYALSGTLDPLWVLPAHGPFRASVRVDPSGVLAVGSRDDTLYVAEADGTVRVRYNVGSDVDAPVAVAHDGTLYIGTDHGALLALP